jgi:hypothetical protein
VHDGLNLGRTFELSLPDDAEFMIGIVSNIFLNACSRVVNAPLNRV